MTAQILNLRRRRTCVGCQHYSTGTDLAVEPRCVEWDEPLDDDSIGATCPDYQQEDTPR